VVWGNSIAAAVVDLCLCAGQPCGLELCSASSAHDLRFPSLNLAREGYKTGIHRKLTHRSPVESGERVDHDTVAANEFRATVYAAENALVVVQNSVWDRSRILESWNYAGIVHSVDSGDIHGTPTGMAGSTAPHDADHSRSLWRMDLVQEDFGR
jgi:hypothetical protein